MHIKKLLIPFAIIIFFQKVISQDQKLEVVKIAQGVYAMMQSEPRFDPVEPNSIVIIGKDSVIVFDSNRSPAGSRRIIAQIRKLTKKPVKYLINSHWHDDHIFGNQAYQEAFPNIEIIAHRNTRDDMQTLAFLHIRSGIDRFTKTLAKTENILRKGVKEDGTSLTQKERSDLENEAKTYKDFLPSIKTIRLTLPTMVFDDKLTIYNGGREIQLLYFGIGNTRGDIVAYLPAEKILLTGDLLVHPVPYAFGSFMGDWVQTMKKLGEQDVRIIIPGHGPILRDKTYLKSVTKLLESLYAQVKVCVEKGFTLEETRKAVNLESFRKEMAGDDPVRNDTFDFSLIKFGIRHAYQEICSKEKRQCPN